MKNLVTELDRLNNAVTCEVQLRTALGAEMQRGIDGGPMRHAHDAQVQECIDAAKCLIDKVNDTD